MPDPNNERLTSKGEVKMSENPEEKLTTQDYNDIWYLVDYYGRNMWTPEKVQRLRVLIKDAEKSAAE